MEHYIVSARKYRPSSFGTVVGQKALTAALKHAVATDRLAHAYLFCGSRGVGKTSCARIFAKTINCQHRTPDGEACNECDSCREFNNGTSLNIIELDAASHNGVDDIKALTEQVQVPPTRGKYRVFIIDEVHMLTSAAFNAFLKTLEEPPEYVIFILATTEKHKIIPTILSRCQIYDFNRITIQDMVVHLAGVAQKEGISVEDAALNIIARKADGAMRDALSIFDQVAASTMGNVTYQNTIDNLNILDSAYYSRLTEAFLANDVPTALLIYKEIRDKGFDSQFFLNGLALYLRDLMLAYTPSTLGLMEASDEVKAQMAALAAKCPVKFIYKAMDLCNDADLNFRVATNKQFLVELTLVKLSQITAQEQEAPARQIKPIAPQQPAQPQAAPQQPAQQPAPGYQQPKAAYQPPQPAYQPPQTAYRPPQPAYHPPQPAYQPPQPAYRPPQPAYQAPQAVRQNTAGVPSFSIRGQQTKQDDAAAQADNGEAHRRNAPFSLPELEKAWTKYAEDHPSERILANTMLSAMPAQVGPGNFSIEVDDAIQVDMFNESKPSILAYLRDCLSNDFIEVTATIRQGEPSPITWTQRKVLEHMAEKHPDLQTLISEFSLIL